MARRVNRSSTTGRFISKAAAARGPGRTTTERVGTGTSNSRTIHRSSITGRFIQEAALSAIPAEPSASAFRI